MLTLTDLAPMNLWDEMVRNKFITERKHPTLNLRILKYTVLTQYKQEWNEATINARGLIVNDDNEIVARPFKKFFNFSELTSEQKSKLSGPVTVMDKVDGSLGIGYVNPKTGLINLATPGSFNSKQANHGTQLYLNKYDGTWEPQQGFTYLWEIVFAENHIIVDYGDFDDIILLGRVNNETGETALIGDINEWHGKRAQTFNYHTLEDAIKAEPRENAEGFVVHLHDTDDRVKLKQEDYMAIHRAVFGYTKLQLWKLMSKGEPLDRLLVNAPEELLDEIEGDIKDLTGQREELRNRLELMFNEIMGSLGGGTVTHKDFALAVETKRIPKLDKGFMFAMLKNEVDSVEAILWNRVRPAECDKQ